jgi:hypothetical protein
MVLGYLFKHKELNHRQLALKIHQDLIDKKSPIHLETIIAVLNGKTKRVRKILQDQLEAYFQQEGLKDRQDIQKYLLQQAQIEKNKGENYSWNQLISSTQVIQTVSDLLTKYQSLTRRQLAIQLKEDLGKENLHYSLSTLQWILGGKNQKVKAIIKKYLDLYLNEDKIFRPREEPTNLEVKRGGRPSYTQKLTKIYEQVQTASAENRGALFREFMDLREKFIKKRWLLKHPVVSPLYSTSGESENFKEEENWKEEPCNLNPDTIWMDRLVS